MTSLFLNAPHNSQNLVKESADENFPVAKPSATSCAIFLIEGTATNSFMILSPLLESKYRLTAAWVVPIRSATAV
jgi:hypothetical protein